MTSSQMKGNEKAFLNKRKRLKRDYVPGPSKSGQPGLWVGLWGNEDAEGREILSSVGTEDVVAEEAQKRRGSYLHWWGNASLLRKNSSTLEILTKYQRFLLGMISYFLRSPSLQVKALWQAHRGRTEIEYKDGEGMS